VVTALTKEKVQEAKALILEPQHWARQGTERVVDGQHSYCAGGALAMVIEGRSIGMYSCATHPLGDYLFDFTKRAGIEDLEEYIDGSFVISHWNDILVENHSEVLATFDKVIASFEE
jgi:hypothetical protein